MIDAAGVVKELSVSPIGDKLKTESQARELSRVEPAGYFLKSSSRLHQYHRRAISPPAPLPAGRVFCCRGRGRGRRPAAARAGRTSRAVWGVSRQPTANQNALAGILARPISSAPAEKSNRMEGTFSRRR